MAVTESEEVFDAMMQSSLTTASSAAKNSRFTSSTSMIASTTRWQAESAFSSPTSSMRPSVASASFCLTRPFSTSLASDCAMESLPAWAAPALAS